MAISNDCLKAKRGMVFFVEDKSIVSGSVEKKDRPCLVVSNDTGNFFSKVLTVVSVTSRDYASGPYQVLFKNIDNKPNVIMCEQIKTVSVNQLKSYMWTVSDDVMRKVDAALAISLGINFECTIQDAINRVNSIVENLIKTKSKNSSTLISKLAEEYALEVAQNLENLYDNGNDTSKNKLSEEEEEEEFKPVEHPKRKLHKTTVKSESSNENTHNLPLKPKELLNPVIPESFICDIEEDKDKDNTSDKFNNTVSLGTKRNTNRKYNYDPKQLLDDCNKLTVQELLKKYGFKDPKTLYNQKYAAKKLLKVHE